MAFRCMTGHAPEYLTSQFLPREQVSKRTTRSSQKLNIALFTSASEKRTLYYRAIKLWNNLEPSLKTSRSVQVFFQSPSAFNDGDHLTWSNNWVGGGEVITQTLSGQLYMLQFIFLQSYLLKRATEYWFDDTQILSNSLSLKLAKLQATRIGTRNATYILQNTVRKG